MKNEFKKSDSKGNKLPEEIGKGLNYNHPSKVIKKMLNDRLEFKINSLDKETFAKWCVDQGGVSKVLRNYVNNCIKR